MELNRADNTFSGIKAMYKQDEKSQVKNRAIELLPRVRAIHAPENTQGAQERDKD